MKNLLLAILCLGGAVAWANPMLTTTNLLTELMMNDESASSTIMAIFFGVDLSSQPAFTTHVDPVGLSYSFASQPGDTYLGQGLTVSGSGAYDTNTGITTMSSTGMLGSNPWTTSGNFFVTRVSTGYAFTGTESFVSGPASLPPTRCVTITFVGAELNDDGTSEAIAKWTNDCNETAGIATQEDIYEISGDYAVVTLLNGEVHSIKLTDEGDSPPEGGDGNYHISFASTPEPSSGLLLGGGLVGMAVRFWKKRLLK